MSDFYSKYSLEFSRGPWTRTYAQNVYQENNRLIATCEPSNRSHTDWDQTYANARLISQSPRMLELLLKIKDRIEDRKESEEYTDIMEELIDILTKVHGI